MTVPEQRLLPFRADPTRSETSFRRSIYRPLGKQLCGPLKLEMSVAEDEVVVDVTCDRCGAKQAQAWAPWEEPPSVMGSWENYDEGFSEMPFDLLEGLRSCSQGQVLERGQLSWTASVDSRLRELTAEAARRCDQSALAACRPFSQKVRASVYWAVRLDPTGRVLQLARAHPGFLLMVAHLSPLSPPQGEVVDLRRLPLWKAILSGESLRTLAGRMGEQRAMDAAEIRRLAWTMDKVPAMTPPNSALALVATPEVPLSDLPRGEDARVMWLDTLSLVRFHIHPEQREAPWAVAALRWASLHYEELDRLDGFRLERLIRFLSLQNRRPARNRSLASLLREQEHWWDNWIDVIDGMAVLRKLEAQGHGNLPKPPFPAYEAGGLSITPICTARQLLDETQVMGHCVFTYLTWVQSAEVVVYSMQLGQQRSTILLKRRPGGWSLEEHAGKRNQPASTEETRAVIGWLESQQSAPEAQSGGGATN